MILVDTSVWVDHLRSGEPALAAALRAGKVLCHPFVIGEIACGSLRDRAGILALLAGLPAAPVATHGEALLFLEERRLFARGIGFVDVHLLAATALASPARLWTRDRPLRSVAAELDLAHAAGA